MLDRNAKQLENKKTNLVFVVISFLLPAILFLIIFRIAPFLSSVYESLFISNISSTTKIFSGFENYRTLINSSQFLNSLKVTIIFLLIINPFQILIALFLSVVLIQKIPGGKLLRTLIFFPVAVPPAVTALVWGLGLKPEGIINSIIISLGFQAQPLLTSPDQALACVILILSWAGIGYWMVFLIASLKDIPNSLLEAGVIDGANWWVLFFHVMVPMMKKTLAFVLVANTIANFITFAHIQVLTKGGPSGSTDLIMYQIYRQVFQYGNANLGAAQTTLLMLVILSIVIVEFRILKSENE